MSTSTVDALATKTPKWEATTDELLHMFLSLGAIAANIFVKNNQHRTLAAQIIQGVNQALPLIDSSLGVQTQTTN